MLKLSNLLLLVFFVVSSVFEINSQDKNPSYTLKACIDYALSNNETIKNATFDTKIADAQVDEVLADGLPQVNGNIAFTNNTRIQITPFPDFITPQIEEVLIREGIINEEDRSSPGLIPAEFNTNFTGNTGISVSQLIFDGSFFMGLKAANSFKQLSSKEQIKTQIDIVEAVSKAYYAVLVSQENLELTTKNYNRLDSLLRETRLLYENGFAEKIDVNRVQIQFNNIRTTLKNSAESLKISLSLLKFQMGMPIEEPIQLAEELDEIKLESIEESLNDFNHKQRIEYDILETNRELAFIQMKNNRINYAPELYANFNVGWFNGANTINDFFTFNDMTWPRYSNWGLTLSIPIFDGFRKSNLIQQNKIEVQQLNNSMGQLKNQIKMEVQTARIELNNALQQLETQKENIELTKEVYDVSKIKYQEGVGANIEVIEADADYKEAQTNYYNALYEALIARVDLEKALGILMN